MICPHCGADSKQRSSPQHRRFFKLINVAYHHWPEYTEFSPDNAEHLRAWLLCKSKHRNVVELESPGELSEEAVALMGKP
jgi:hypothetical protein